MATYCDPQIDGWEWHDAPDSWHLPEREQIDRTDIFKPTTRNRTQTAESLREEFARLVTSWRDDTENLSSLTAIVSHEAYQRIIDLGIGNATIVRLILQDLRENGGYWSTALIALTGENPIEPANIGRPEKIRQDWVRWGKQSGFL
jgi:hypothetical protein